MTPADLRPMFEALGEYVGALDDATLVFTGGYLGLHKSMPDYEPPRPVDAGRGQTDAESDRLNRTWVVGPLGFHMAIAEAARPARKVQHAAANAMDRLVKASRVVAKALIAVAPRTQVSVAEMLALTARRESEVAAAHPGPPSTPGQRRPLAAAGPWLDQLTESTYVTQEDPEGPQPSLLEGPHPQSEPETDQVDRRREGGVVLGGETDGRFLPREESAGLVQRQGHGRARDPRRRATRRRGIRSVRPLGGPKRTPEDH